MRDLLDLMGDTGQPPKGIGADVLPATEPTSPPNTLKSEHVELDMVLHYDNEVKGTILVSKSGAESEAVWLKDVEFVRTGKSAPATTTAGKPVQGGLPIVAVNVPEWLARDKGLLS